jgi:hypothetical protein
VLRIRGEGQATAKECHYHPRQGYFVQFWNKQGY